MPGPWLLLHLASLLLTDIQNPPKKTIKFGSDVTITYESGGMDVQTQTWIFDKGVTLEYDVTTVRADHLEVDVRGQMGTAIGHVHLIDPVATVDAENLRVWWAPDQRRGHAENTVIQIGSSHLKAKTLDIGPNLWVLHDVEGTTSRAHPAWYEVHSPSLKVVPGQRGTIEHPTLYILGHKILTFPNRTFNLDRRTEGVTVPGFNYSRQYGLGISWGGGFLVDHATDFAFAFGIFPDSRPGYGASLTRSLLPDTKPTTLITPQSDFGERFRFGYLDNIAVAQPESEDRIVRSDQKTISVDSAWNQVLTDRGTSTPFSKAVEAVYELGGAAGGFGYIAEARLQTIREFGDPYTERMILVGDLGPPAIHLTQNLRTLLRFDTNMFLGNYQYGWVRGEAGLAYSPVKQVRISGGTYYSGDFGTPQYLIDPLYSKAGYVLRTDLDFGPTKVSFMEKYDSALGWFDREYTVSQVVGCFEPFVMYRENPSDYQLGLRLRLDDLTELLDKRNFARTKPVEHVISPSPTGTP